MAYFDWTTCAIAMRSDHGGYGGSVADLARVPSDPSPTVSFAHEYVHFLQHLGSLVGFRMLGELIDLSVKGALVLSGVVSPEGGEVSTAHRIGPLLRAQPDAAGASYAGIRERVGTIFDEARVLFGLDDYPSTTGGTAWDVRLQRLTSGSYADDFYGVVTPAGRFRPINVAMLAEGMARRIDRWLAQNEKFTHDWAGSAVEDEVYNSIRTLLLQPRYARAVSESTVDRLTVVVCHLALATRRPDHAVTVMADHLARGPAAGGLPQTVALELRDLLSRHRLLDPGAFNIVMNDALHGASSVMDRTEFYGIYSQLKRIQDAANIALFMPDFFARENVDWKTVREWMERFSVPVVRAQDGDAASIDGVTCTRDVGDLLMQCQRVLLAA